MKVIVVRHGRTEWNDLKKVQGQADIGLNNKGKEQAKTIAKLLEDKNIDLIFSSPLIRAKETAEIINANRNVPIVYDNRISERDYGEYEGLHRSEFEFNDFWTYSKNMNYDKAENIQVFFKRVYDFLDEIKEKYKYKTLVIVTHSGTSTVIDSYSEGLPREGEMNKNHLKNCEVREYIFDEPVESKPMVRQEVKEILMSLRNKGNEATVNNLLGRLDLLSDDLFSKGFKNIDNTEQSIKKYFEEKVVLMSKRRKKVNYRIGSNKIKFKERELSDQ